MTLVLAMLAMVTVVSAQTSLGIKGGVNMSNFYGDEITDKNMLIGGQVGIIADYEFMPNMAIQTGLMFTTKGAKYTGELLGIKGDYTTRPMYLQLPVHFAYKLDVAPTTRIVFHGGPYAAVGVAGKSNLSVSAGDNELGKTESTPLFGDKGSLNRFDAGLGIGVGAEFGVFLVDLGWDFGLMNISKNENANMKNQNAYLSVGYKF